MTLKEILFQQFINRRIGKYLHGVEDFDIFMTRNEKLQVSTSQDDTIQAFIFKVIDDANEFFSISIFLLAYNKVKNKLTHMCLL